MTAEIPTMATMATMEDSLQEEGDGQPEATPKSPHTQTTERRRPRLTLRRRTAINQKRRQTRQGDLKQWRRDGTFHTTAEDEWQAPSIGDGCWMDQATGGALNNR